MVGFDDENLENLGFENYCNALHASKGHVDEHLNYLTEFAGHFEAAVEC